METISNFITTNDIRIHYERTGGGKPPLVMCHGITDNGRCLKRLAEHLTSDYDVILVDARGHGKSDAPDSGYSANHHADDIKGLINGLGLEDPILYGHSMGARTVCKFGAKYSNIPRAIILEDPVYIIPPTESELIEGERWLKQMMEEALRWKSMTFEEHFYIAQQQEHKDWTKQEQVEWAKSKLQVSPKVFEIGLSMAQIRNDFSKIQCPVFILKADADEEIRIKNKEAAALIPNGKLIHIPGAGHNISRDDFAVTTHHIDAFLETL